MTLPPVMPQSFEFLTWRDVNQLIDYLLPQLIGPYDALLMITRGASCRAG